MRELPAFAAALLFLAAFHRAGLVRAGKAVPDDLAWFAGLSLAAVGGHFAFRGSPAFLPVLATLLGFNVLRVRAGGVLAGVEPFRYAVVAAAFLFAGGVWPALLAFVVVAARVRNVRLLLAAASRIGGPFSISPLDVDRIVPPPIVYERKANERGMTLLEVTVALAVLAAVSGSLFTASAGRAGRLRMLSETARAREAAVSELERLGTLGFAEVAAAADTGFPVPGGGEPGRRTVVVVEPGVVSVTVTVPRRGAAPLVLTTLRAETVR